MGLVTEIVPAKSSPRARRNSRHYSLARSPTSIARTKRLLVGYDDVALQAELEVAVRENADIRSTADFREGLASFLEKRAPKWRASKSRNARSQPM